VDEDAVERYRRHVSVFTGTERERLYSSEFARSVDPTVAKEVVGRPWREASGRERLDVMLEVDIATYLPDDLLVKMDIATMTYSLEARSPLLDPEVMEFAASLPASDKLHRLRKKWALRRAYRDVIPTEILSGAKQGFAIPLGDWLRGELKSYAYDVLFDRRTIERGFFDPNAVRHTLDSHVLGRSDRSQQIWALLIFEQWHREFVDGPG
jgi:asparagine synthase (glutamine-hydrolysing)